MKNEFIKMWQWIKQISHELKHAHPKPMAKIRKIWTSIKKFIAAIGFLKTLSWVMKLFLRYGIIIIIQLSQWMGIDSADLLSGMDYIIH